MMAAGVALGASAAVPFVKGVTAPIVHKTPVKVVAKAIEQQVILDEDFSKFTEGSESAPAEEIEYIGGYRIPATRTAMDGWTGKGVHPAGGCVQLTEYDYEGEMRPGYISTPRQMMNGTATLTFRAKASSAEGAELWVVLCDDDYGPGYDELELELTDEWTSYELVATEGSLELESYFQFTPESGEVLLDDVKILFKQDRIAKPAANAAVNVSPTEFVASWNEVTGATGYRLNVICTEAVDNAVSGSMVADFEGINLAADGKTIDSSNPGTPDGWTFSLSEKGDADVTTDPQNVSSGKAIVFDAVGDIVETADMPYPIDGLSFWVRPSIPYDEDYMNQSLLRVEIYHSTTGYWENISQLAAFYFNPDGGVYSFPTESLGDDVTRVRLSMIQHSVAVFYVDDLTIHYSERGVTKPYIKDLDLTECSYTVKDINPKNEYSYWVQAVNGELVSAESYVVWVDGIRGLSVETLEPTDVSATGFTANWKPLGHATEYKVETFRSITPQSDLSDVLVIEEDFEGITEGTIDNPGYDWSSPYDFSANGMTATAWGATEPRWIAGMAGTNGTNYWMGTAGLVFTPTLDLSCYDGTGIKVEATVYTTVTEYDYYDETGNVATDTEGMFAMILSGPTSTNPLGWGYMDTPALGSNSGVMTIQLSTENPDLSSVIIAFMNKSGQMFFVDNARITMNVPAGKSLMTPYGVASTTDTSVKFGGLDPICDYAYSVTASTTRNYETFTSSPSPLSVVYTSTGIENVAAGPEAAQVAVLPGSIAVSAADGVTVKVYGIDGKLTAKGMGNCTLSVGAGVYVVRVGQAAYKVAVK